MSRTLLRQIDPGDLLSLLSLVSPSLFDVVPAPPLLQRGHHALEASGAPRSPGRAPVTARGPSPRNEGDLRAAGGVAHAPGDTP